MSLSVVTLYVEMTVMDGLTALELIVRDCPTLVVLPVAVSLLQNMLAGFTKFFADNLNQVSALPVHEAQDGRIIQPQKVYLAHFGFICLLNEAVS